VNSLKSPATIIFAALSSVRILETNDYIIDQQAIRGIQVKEGGNTATDSA